MVCNIPLRLCIWCSVGCLDTWGKSNQTHLTSLTGRTCTSRRRMALVILSFAHYMKMVLVPRWSWLTMENKDTLWETGVLNTTTPDGLQKAVLFYVRCQSLLLVRYLSSCVLITLRYVSQNMVQRTEMEDSTSFMLITIASHFSSRQALPGFITRFLP